MSVDITSRRIEAAANIVDVWMGGRRDWRGDLHDSDFLESADWEMALQLADAALAAPPAAADRIDILELALERARTILANMALEHTTGWRGIFARWPIHHEPLRNDARRALPQVEAALGIDSRTCTCHPDDDPPRPCPRRFALSACRATTPEPSP